MKEEQKIKESWKMKGEKEIMIRTGNETWNKN